MLTKTPESQAAEYANNILNAINQTLTRAKTLIANGAPANPQLGAPAVTADALAAALGPVNSAIVQLMLTAITTPDAEKIAAAIAALTTDPAADSSAAK